MRPEISEFSFGYALTEALVRDGSSPILAAPLFPSLVKEGLPGGGYDVMLQHGDGLAFLQFKLSDCMVSGNARECKLGHFFPPFFRMHIRPAWISNQHAMLCDWALRGHWVYYAAPAFYTQDQFNDAYRSKRVVERTMFISPLEIGALDGAEHHVAFSNGYFQLYSEAGRKVNGDLGRGWFDRLRNARTVPRGALRKEAESAVASLGILLKEYGRTSDVKLLQDAIAQRHEDPVAQLADVSRILFDCEVLVLGQSLPPEMHHQK